MFTCFQLHSMRLAVMLLGLKLSSYSDLKCHLSYESKLLPLCRNHPGHINFPKLVEDSQKNNYFVASLFISGRLLSGPNLLFFYICLNVHLISSTVLTGIYFEPTLRTILRTRYTLPSLGEICGNVLQFLQASFPYHL